MVWSGQWSVWSVRLLGQQRGMSPFLETSVIIILPFFFISFSVHGENLAVTKSQECHLKDTQCGTNEDRRYFPTDFIFGASSASYQIEGAWDADGKAENIWDRFTHEHPELIDDRSNGDVACDSYNKYRDDVDILEDIGVHFYRFSLSWSRILSNGTVNPRGVDYYNNVINELLGRGIKPIVALDHWDLPQSLQDLGGWTNPSMVQHFTEYARVAYTAFGDRVDHWLTFNQAVTLCVDGYGSDRKPPMLNSSGLGEYLCGHNVLKAHAAAYHLYHDEFQHFKGKVSIILTAQWYDPATESPEDQEAGERCNQFEIGWFAHPIFSKSGDYPPEMKNMIAKYSKEQGFSRSRLPEFTEDEIAYIRGTSDYFGINHYTTNACRHKAALMATPETPSYESDRSAEVYQKPEWPATASSWLKVVPWGFGKLLIWIKKTYDNPDVFVYENGVSDRGGLDDEARIDFYHQYINSMLDAMDEGCKVSGFAVWSIMDNFEWKHGYTERFGLYAVDFSSPNRTRTAKKSAVFYKDLIKRRWISLNI